MSFEQPAALWLIPAAAGLTVWLARRSLAGLSTVRWWAAVLSRIVVASLLILAAAGAQWNRTHDQLSVVYVLDLSRSVPRALRDVAWRFVRDSSQTAPADDRTGILTFDRYSYIEQLPQKPGPDGAVHIDKLSPPLDPDRTDIAQGLRMAMAMFPENTAKRIVLVTDGNETEGDALTEVRNASANGVAVDVVPLRYRHRNEVMFEKLQAPAYASLHDQVRLRLLLRSERETSGTVRLYHNGRLVDLDPDQPGPGQRVTLQPGVNPLTIRLPLHRPGAHKFEARFEPDAEVEDEILNNNVATAFTNVEGPASVLYIRHSDDDAHDSTDDRPLWEALAKENVEVVSVTAAEADLDPVTLQQYSAVVLGNVPADEFTASQHRALATYARDLGGGLIMIGGDDSFGAGGWQGSVVEAVMPVRFDVDEMKQIPRGALVVMMHACEMAQGNFWSVEVTVAALRTLSRLDYFGLVDWGARGFDWAVPLRLADNKRGIERKIRQMQNSDMPDYHVPLDMAYKALRSRKDAAQKHIIMISDGDAAPPSPGLLNKLRGAKITVSTITVFPHGGPFGGGSTMRNIANKTGGKHYLLNKPGDEKKLPQIFIKEAKIVRRPLLREERFRPRIKSRLSEIMDGISGELPPLDGYVVTTARSESEIELPLVSDKGDPILAHWQCGLGRSVAFTSGWWTRWGADWPSWPHFSKLWAQTVRWSMAQGTAANFEVMTRVEGDRGKVVIEALNKDTAYLNFLQMRGVVIGPQGEPKRINLQQTGPGRYEADFPASDAGSYLVNIQAAGAPGEPGALIRTGVSVAYSREFRELSANESLLQRIVNESPNGRLLDPSPAAADVFAHNLPETISRLPIWNLLTRLAVAMFLIDVAVRRIAVDPRTVARRVRGFIADLAGRFAPGRRAEAVLGDLKAVRRRVRSEQTATGESTEAAAADAQPAVNRARRFEADAADLKKPLADLRRAVGGADAPRPPAPGAAAAPKEQGPVESMTARLLRAKRRQSGPSDTDKKK
ncbi:MAG: VWA domain-containing protein [Phycisphaerae bacterium]